MYDPNQYPPQPGYPQNQYPPQQAYPPPYGQYPPQPGYPQSQYPPQPGYPQNQYPPQQPPYGQYPPQERAQRRAYRRRRRASMFQIRMGALSCIAIVAGLYFLVSGQAKNPVAAFGLIGGGILVFVLVVVLPSLLSR